MCECWGFRLLFTSLKHRQADRYRTTKGLVPGDQHFRRFSSLGLEDKLAMISAKGMRPENVGSDSVSPAISTFVRTSGFCEAERVKELIQGNGLDCVRIFYQDREG